MLSMTDQIKKKFQNLVRSNLNDVLAPSLNPKVVSSCIFEIYVENKQVNIFLTVAPMPRAGSKENSSL